MKSLNGLPGKLFVPGRLRGQRKEEPRDDLPSLCLQGPCVFQLDFKPRNVSKWHWWYKTCKRINNQQILQMVADPAHPKSIVILYTAVVAACQVKYPENFFLLRGNHESPSICRMRSIHRCCFYWCGTVSCSPVAVQDIWLLWWVQVAVQHQDLEDFLWLGLEPAHAAHVPAVGLKFNVTRFLSDFKPSEANSPKVFSSSPICNPAGN